MTSVDPTIHETTPFVGRRRELDLLGRLREKKTASLVVLRGRRRIGKSRLAEEFGRSYGGRYLVFTGLAPARGLTARIQRVEFARQMQQRLGVPSPPPNDWSTLFAHLGYHCRRGRTLVVLDEITWLGAKDQSFLPKLKAAWDTTFSRNPRLVMILSGSVSGWIERNILASSGFLGRVSLDIVLEELDLGACAQFWGAHRELVSAYEKLKVLAVTGGVPRYLEEILPARSAEDNVTRLCFEREGLLFSELEHIFTDLFARRAAVYRGIVERLGDGAADVAAIHEAMGSERGGVLGTYLDDLVAAGFVARDFTWSLHTGEESRFSRYRLRDNYLRFYLKHIAPNRRRIERGHFRLPRAWHGILGLQFESLVLHNRGRLLERLGIDVADVVNDNPFFQRPTKRKRGCQIDYLVQTKFNTLYVCEIRFSRTEIARAVVDEVRQKIARLARPKHQSVRPVLVHVNGISDAVLDSEAFAHVVDFASLF
jgi:AAA+ ATPase superfamily predicted ATPase